MKDACNFCGERCVYFCGKRSWRDGSYEHPRHWFYEELARNINSPFICSFSVRSWIDSLNELHHEKTGFGLCEKDTTILLFRNFKLLAFFCCYTGQFMLDLGGNPKNLISRVTAQILLVWR